MGRRRYVAPVKRNSTFLLNITSMTDMFTIMLVFLLQTYSTSNIEITPEKGIRLPQSNTTLSPVEGVRLSLTKSELKLGDKTISTLQDNQFAPAALDSKDPSFLPSLFAELNKLAEDKSKEHLKEGRLMLQADAGLPYETLRKVMYTASMAGFPQLKMITMVGN